MTTPLQNRTENEPINLTSKLNINLKKVPRIGLHNIQWKEFDNNYSKCTSTQNDQSNEPVNAQAEYFQRLSMFIKDIDETLMNFPYFAIY